MNVSLWTFIKIGAKWKCVSSNETKKKTISKLTSPQKKKVLSLLFPTWSMNIQLLPQCVQCCESFPSVSFVLFFIFFIKHITHIQCISPLRVRLFSSLSFFLNGTPSHNWGEEYIAKRVASTSYGRGKHQWRFTCPAYLKRVSFLHLIWKYLFRVGGSWQNTCLGWGKQWPNTCLGWEKSKDNYLFRVHFESPCTSMVSTFQWQLPPPPPPRS